MNPTTLEAGYCILLCAHNGAAYLAEQLDSIVRQTVQPSRVLFFDDASSDGSMSIAEQYLHRLPISFLQLEKRRGGAVGAFDAVLLHAAHAPKQYAAYLLCDQDDIWEPHKAARLLGRLAEVPAGTPALVHSELKCFGEASVGRGLLHESLGHSQFESTPASPLRNLLFENVVVGASAAFNHHLLQCGTPMPQQAFMHDWWLALVCVARGGEILYLDEPLVRYRIHGQSTVGQAGNFMHALPRRLKALKHSVEDPWLRSVAKQLHALPFGEAALPTAFFEPLLAEARDVFFHSSLQQRYRAWRRLRRDRIWSVTSKDVYYKMRLFTDYVARRQTLA